MAKVDTKDMEITTTPEEQTMFSKDDLVTAKNPQTGNVEQGIVVKFTKDNWVHVKFDTGTYRFLPYQVSK